MDRKDKGTSLILCIDDYVVIDIETTGLSPKTDKIIEIGAVKVVGGKIVDKLQRLIKTEKKLRPFITKLTGISDAMLVDAPTINDVLEEFSDFISDSILIGHNVNFDINFLYDNYIEILNQPLSNSFIDTMQISRKLYPKEKHHKLQNLVERFNIDVKNSHRALADATATYECYEKLKRGIIKNQ